MNYNTLLVLISALSISAASHAQNLPAACPEKPVDQASTKALAKAWFDKGEQLVEKEEYAEAWGAFNCSLRMIEHPATQFNAARAAYLSGQSSIAIKLLEEMLPKTSEQAAVKEITDLVAQIRKEHPEPEQPSEKPVVAETRQPEKQAGTETQSESETEPKPGPAPQASIQSKKEAGPLLQRTIAYVVLGTSGAAVVTGSVMQILAGLAQKTTEETDDYSEYEEAKSSLGRYQTVATVSFISGGVLLGAGITLLLLSGDKEESHMDLAVAPLPSGLSVQGRF